MVREVLGRMEETATLEVVASNRPAVRLYESLGFWRVGLRDRAYQGVSVTVLMMKRSLSEHL